jgi:hypothetical protein
MIKPARYLITDWFWQRYFKFIIKSDFQHFCFNRDITISSGKALLVLANHFSWWDGFFIYQLNQLYFKKRLHLMMLEDQLQSHPYLRLAGAYSIYKKGKKLIESLSYTSQLLENPQNLVVIFPQGKIESMHVPYIQFAKGIKYITDNCQKEIQIIFSIALIDYASFRKPTLQLYLKEFSFNKPSSLEELEKAFNQHYQEAHRQQRLKYCV